MSKKVFSRIKEGVPVTKARTKAGRSKYPFKDMKINSSFEVRQPGMNFKDLHAVHRLAQTVRAAGRRYGKFTGKKFLVRATDDCIICWRIE